MIAAVDLWADVRPDSARRLLLAAVDAFASHGYAATTTREISSAAGVSPAALYVHYPTKADLLVRISRDGHQATLDVGLAALDGVEGPAARLHALVATFTRWHARHSVVARVVQYELAALPPDAFAEVARLRRRIEGLVRAEVEAGAATGELAAADPALTARALMSMCIDVARWYGTGTRGRPDPDRLAAEYADLALRMVTAPQ